MRYILSTIIVFLVSFSAYAQTFECDSLGVDGPFNFIVDSDPEEICLGTTFCLDFKSENLQSVLGFQFTLAFDPSKVLFVSFEDSQALRGSVAANTNDTANGQVPILWTDIAAEGFTVDDSTSIFTTCFVVVGEPSDDVEIFFNDGLVPSFPGTVIVYQTEPTRVCVSNTVLLNEGDVLDYKVCCNELSITDLTNCSLDRNISLSACGGASPYEVNLIGASGTLTMNINNDGDAVSFDNLDIGAYTVSINDSNGVNVMEQVNVIQTDELTFDLSVSNPSCSYSRDGMVSIENIQGGEGPYTVRDENGLYYFSEDENEFIDLENGSYNFFISDASGCMTTEAVTLFQAELTAVIDIIPPTCTNSTDGMISISGMGGTPFANGQYDINGLMTDNFVIDDGIFLSPFYNTQTGLFRVRIDDLNGCVFQEDITIPLENTPGEDCDDMDPNTINDVIQNDCSCMGEFPGELYYLGNTNIILPPDITITLDRYSGPYNFPNGTFDDPATGISYPFPLELGVHYDGIGTATFFSSVSPDDDFFEGETVIQYIIEDNLGNELSHGFTVTIECLSMTNCVDRIGAPTCAEALESPYFSCDLGATNGVIDIVDCAYPWDGVEPQSGQPSPLCGGQGVASNMSWYAFKAGSEEIDITVCPSECIPGANGLIGIQAGIYDACNGDCIAGDNSCTSVEICNEFSLASLTIGQTYFLYVDGCGGSECIYNINITSDTGESYTESSPSGFSFISDDVSSDCNSSVNSYCSSCDVDIVVTQDGTGSGMVPGAYPEDTDVTFMWTVNPPLNSQTMFEANPSEDGFFFPTIIDADSGSYGICLVGFLSECNDVDIIFCEELIIRDCDTIDNDMDGFSLEDDCDDNNAMVFPGATEICDGLDNNCDGMIDEGLTATYYTDNDMDGFGDPDSPVQACMLVNGLSNNADDCDDDNADVFPGATEVCDGIDNNCDGMTDEGIDLFVYYADADFDGFGNPMDSVSSCFQPFGFVDNNMDCDDDNNDINPNAVEVCDTVDNNCDGSIDEGLTSVTYYSDADGDGFGDPLTGFDSCLPPPDLVEDNTDCDDTNPLINPDAEEILGNDIDENCDGRDNTTATNELDGPQYTLYPNPTSGLLHIDGIEYERMTISDKLGRKVKEESGNQHMINLSEYSNGLYLIQFYDAKNNLIGLSKIIKGD